jgi:hypothetical protein
MCFSRFLLLASLLVAPAVLAGADRSQPPAGAGRLVAIGDVHGAYDQLVAILTHIKLIDPSQRWTGGRATLVQTGDFTDRGAKVRQVMDLLMALEQSARRGGGQAITLLGNHEVLNILGDYRYVTSEIAATFADARSSARRENAWKDYERLAAARAKLRATLPPALRQTREEWIVAHPLGWLEYREALGPRGRYGRWLRGKAIATTVDGTIFMHAGISPDRPATVDEVNKQARQEMARYEAFLERMVDAKLALPFFTLQEVLEVASAELEAAGAVLADAKAKNETPDLSMFDVPLLREAVEITKIGEWSLLAGEGPLWFRGYANWPEDGMARAKVGAFLDKVGAKRIVVGHTPTKDARIAARYGLRVLVIDTGMLTEAYQGRPSALEIRGTELRALYEDGIVPLAAVSAPAIAPAR